MDLFSDGTLMNLLPYDGEAYYYGKILKNNEIKEQLESLLHHIEWKNDEAVIFGKHIITKRKVAWYADEKFSYTYSNISREALPWTKQLLELKKITERTTGSSYNSCLLNLYHTGDEGMSWHSDDEAMLLKDAAIAAFSFGAERKFSFKHKKTKETIAHLLESGSLLAMKGTTQTNWLHSIPKTKKTDTPRVSLTFRTIIT